MKDKVRDVQSLNPQSAKVNREGTSLFLRNSVLTGMKLLNQQNQGQIDSPQGSSTQQNQKRNKKSMSLQMINSKKKYGNADTLKLQGDSSKGRTPSSNRHSQSQSAPQDIQVDGFDSNEPYQKQLINYSIMQQVAVLQPGKSFGELALMTQKPRVATIVAKQNGYFAIVQKVAFKRILQRYIEKQMKENIDFLHQHLFFKQLGGFSMRKLFYYFKQKVYGMQTHVYRQKTRDAFHNKGHIPLLKFKNDYITQLNNSVQQLQEDYTNLHTQYASASPSYRRNKDYTTIHSQMNTLRGNDGHQANFTQAVAHAKSQAPDQTAYKQEQQQRQLRQNLIYFIKEGQFEMNKQIHLTSAMNQLSDQHKYVKIAYMKLNSNLGKYCRLKDFYEQIRPEFKGFQKRLKQQQAQQQLMSINNIYNQVQMRKNELSSKKSNSQKKSKRANARIYEIIQEESKMKQIVLGKSNCQISQASLAAQDRQQKHMRKLFEQCQKYIPMLEEYSQSSMDKLFSILHNELNQIEKDDDYLRKTYYRYISRIKEAKLRQYQLARQRQIQTRGRALETPQFNPLLSQIYDLPMQENIKLPDLQLKPTFADQNSVKKGLQFKQLIKYKKEEKTLKVRVMGPGEIFGIEDSLFRHGGRLTTVTCKSKKGVLLTISVQELLKRLPRQELRKNIFKLSQMKLQFIQDRIRASVNLVAKQHHKYDQERRQRANEQDPSLSQLGNTMEKKYQRNNLSQMSPQAINILNQNSSMDKTFKTNLSQTTFDTKVGNQPFMMDIGGMKAINQWRSRNNNNNDQPTESSLNLPINNNKTFDKAIFQTKRDDLLPKIEFPSIYMTQEQIQAKNDKAQQTQRIVQAKLEGLQESIQNRRIDKIRNIQQRNKLPKIIKQNKILFKNPDIARSL